MPRLLKVMVVGMRLFKEGSRVLSFCRFSLLDSAVRLVGSIRIPGAIGRIWAVVKKVGSPNEIQIRSPEGQELAECLLSWVSLMAIVEGSESNESEHQFSKIQIGSAPDKSLSLSLCVSASLNASIYLYLSVHLCQAL